MSDLPVVGDRLRLQITAVGNGGVCIARHEQTVVLVRHTLPGEQVVAIVTETHARYVRADAVQILVPAPERVRAPCPHAGPGRCGGCDWQHASAPAQRALKAAVVREQFTRVAGLDVDRMLAAVEELPGGLLGWRTRISYAVDPDGRAGLRRHRSHELEVLEQCPLGAPGVGDTDALHHRWPGARAVEVLVGTDGTPAVLEHRRSRGRGRANRVRQLRGPERVHHEFDGREFRVSAGGFWQVHPAALPAIADAARDMLAPQPGEFALELYAGAGPLTAMLADAVGPAGQVLGLESSTEAVRDAAGNLAPYPWATVRRVRVDADMIGRVDTGRETGVDLVLLDPPRTGTGAALMRAVLAAAPRAVCYVSCDPATLARDVAAAGELGWHLARLRAFDAFPMTHHVECVALLLPPGGDTG